MATNKLLQIPAVLVVMATLLGLSRASRGNEERHIIYDRIQIPPQWSVIGRAHPKETLKITIALKQRNLDILDGTFWSVSDPNSKQYGQFLTTQQINAIVSPTYHDINRVVQWCKDSGVYEKHIMSFGDGISVKATVEAAENLFKTQMFGFVHDSGRRIVRHLRQYSIPEELIDIIELVSGVSDFPMAQPRKTKRVPLKYDTLYVVPETIRAMYSIDRSHDASNVSQGAIEFQDDSSFNQEDLDTFYSETGVSTTNVSHIVGDYYPYFPDGEASLDIQYLTAVGLNAENWYWTEEGWMYDWCVNFLKASEFPSVVSLSWGWSEVGQCGVDSDCSTYGMNSETYVTRVNIEFKKIGLRGTSILVSSGDSGANGRGDDQCQDSILHPDFPAASPYVTSVGATQIANGIASSSSSVCSVCKSFACAAGGDEIAVTLNEAGFTSGGGFSTYAQRSSSAPYQAEAVEAYLSTSEHLPPSSFFNRNGRAYPDVAALGNNFLIYYDGSWDAVGGTSASAPTFAGIVSILNAERHKLGKPPLGFLNPLLYQMAASDPKTFHDVTEGDNRCTETACFESCKGFEAIAGWDPVTGLGTPSVSHMVEYVRGLGLEATPRVELE